MYLVSDVYTFLERDELLSWIEDKAAYINFHAEPSPWGANSDLLIED